MQHLDAGKVDDESGRYDDSALILSGQHQVIEQLVGAAVGLVGFQRGDKSAHAAPPLFKHLGGNRAVGHCVEKYSLPIKARPHKGTHRR